MFFLFFFLDGIGLGANVPQSNPLAQADMPNLQALLQGKRLTADTPNSLETDRATFLSLDACLGVAGLPQSATGQAVLLTGINVPKVIGYHYGPKPNTEVSGILREGNLFITLKKMGVKAALLNAYPPRYFQTIKSGRRLYSAIPLAASVAGIPLKTAEDYFAGQALSADFTGQGWRTQLGYHDAPVLTPQQAGKRLAELAHQTHFSFFEYWPSDYAGHQQDMQAGVTLLETFDQVLSGLLDTWDDDGGLVMITSDHGNLEDLSTRKHTTNPVPCLVIGSPQRRRQFCTELHNIIGIAPRIINFFEKSIEKGGSHD
jgi:2,3-bisphosphoglycerate-independent phosphoglycerate mutase